MYAFRWLMKMTIALFVYLFGEEATDDFYIFDEEATDDYIN